MLPRGFLGTWLSVPGTISEEFFTVIVILNHMSQWWWLGWLRIRPPNGSPYSEHKLEGGQTHFWIMRYDTINHHFPTAADRMIYFGRSCIWNGFLRSAVETVVRLCSFQPALIVVTLLNCPPHPQPSGGWRGVESERAWKHTASMFDILAVNVHT